MNYFHIQEIIKKASQNIPELNDLSEKNILILPITNKIAGHYCTNIFFNREISKESKQIFLKNITQHNQIKEAELIKGYLNLTFTKEYFEERLEILLKENPLPNIGNGEATNVEFCSVNPTGYLHIGHARNAILGDSIARILEKVNYKVTKEYYVNDGGNQINLMARSIQARYLELNNRPHNFPENGYKGQEMIDVAKKIQKDLSLEEIKEFALNFFIKRIKKDLSKINITHDNWVYESKIIKNQYIEKALQTLSEKNFITSDVREGKRVKKGEASENKLLLLKTTLLGDDQDRPLTKSDGSWTYLAPDIGYHLYKIERGFSFLICTLGADHDSYAKRIKIATKLLKDDIKHETPICQMVSFENEGSLIKFSKRMGNSITIADFLQEINSDILRFMILEKSADTQFVFNYEEAVDLTFKNPVFYCEYAYARACSVLRNIKNDTNEKSKNSDFFENTDVQNLIITLDSFTQTIADAAQTLTPHKITFYLKKLAEKMHKLWQIGKIDASNRLILDHDIAETNTRKQLVEAFLKIAKHCFDCLGIIPLESMDK